MSLSLTVGSTGRLDIVPIGNLYYRTDMMWAQVTATTLSRDLIYANDTGVDSQWIEIGVTDTEALRINTQSQNATGAILPVGVWLHIAWVIQGPRITVYVNGRHYVSLNATASRTAINALAYGGVPNGQFSIAWDGSIACIKSWNRCLSLQEIQVEMQQQLPASHDRIHGAWILNELAVPNGKVGGRAIMTPGGPSITRTASPPIPWMYNRKVYAFVVGGAPPGDSFLTRSYPLGIQRGYPRRQLLTNNLS